MTTPQTPPADAVARLTKLADDYASRGDFATEDDIRTLLAAYAVARLTDDVLDLVVIWSGEHRAYWRANGAGYCESAVGAGLYPRAQAENIVAHCGPEKRIAIRAVRDVLGEAAPECLGYALLAAYADAARDRERTCEWSQDGWCGEGDSTWETECGNAFTINDGPPTENRMAFCCYCGGKVVEVLFVPEPDEDADAARTGEAR